MPRERHRPNKRGKETAEALLTGAAYLVMLGTIAYDVANLCTTSWLDSSLFFKVVGGTVVGFGAALWLLNKSTDINPPPDDGYHGWM